MQTPAEEANEAHRLLTWFADDLARIHELVARQINIFADSLPGLAVGGDGCTDHYWLQWSPHHCGACQHGWLWRLDYFFILLSILAVLVGTLRVRWLSQVMVSAESPPVDVVQRWIHHRNMKNRFLCKCDCLWSACRVTSEP